MLSYQHSYHAGCFADVIKHLALCQILTYMAQKEKPIFYLDTHAGRGLYDLQAKEALKTLEHTTGIAALWAERAQLPSVCSNYISTIQDLNTDEKLRYYPGSPIIAAQLLRQQDRLFLCERHPGEFTYLHSVMADYSRVYCAQEDGYHALLARVPPPEKRGLIMIDPSYEMKQEYRNVPLALQTALRHFSNGVYCIWYPILDKKLHAQLLRGLGAVSTVPGLRAEFYLNSLSAAGMDACGLYLFNPPFSLESTLRHIFTYLLKIFNPGRSSYVLQSIG